MSVAPNRGWNFVFKESRLRRRWRLKSWMVRMAARMMAEMRQETAMPTLAPVERPEDSFVEGVEGPVIEREAVMLMGSEVKTEPSRPMREAGEGRWSQPALRAVRTERC